MSVKTLPTLFTIDSKNKERYWKCEVIDNTLHREYGLIDGKKTQSSREFQGKSIGKKNETSPEDQAWIEANKEWIKHIDKDYHPAKDDKKGIEMYKKVKKAKVKSGGHNINSGAAIGAKEHKNISRKKSDSCIIEDNNRLLIPMKAQVWELENEKDSNSVKHKVMKYFSKIEGKGKTATLHTTDFYCQPKLDGWRAIISKTLKNEILITSNSGKQYPWFKSLRTIIKEYVTRKDINILDGLDGELYSLELYDKKGEYISEDKRFTTICSICGLARTEPHDLEDQIQFHVFDLVDSTGKIPQNERFKMLDDFFEILPDEVKSRVIRVQTHIVDNPKQVSEYHNKYAEQGYEGVMLRSFRNLYKIGKRSNELRKYKNFIDSEYQIIDCKVDQGVSTEHFVWVLKTENNQEFSAKPTGVREEKKYWFENKTKYIGRFMTVKFQEYTEDGIPRFPIAKEFRTNKSMD